MKVFELHFNPKIKEGKIFESFCLEPENVYEKRLGSLYMIGELSNVLPQNIHFLDNLASVIKKEYYINPQRSPEQAFKESLKKANEFLEELSRKKDVSWLGNLRFAVLTFKDFILNFSKTGEIKILLTRKGEILDVSENLEFQDMEPYPLKIFGNIASGKLIPGDKILVFTKDVFNLFLKENLIDKLIQIQNENELNKLFKDKKEIVSNISGICFLVEITSEITPLDTKHLKELTFEDKISTLEKIKNKINIPSTVFVISKEIQKIVNFLKSILKLSYKRIETKNPSKKKFKIRIPNFHLSSFKKNIQKKNLLLIFFLILILSLGTFIFQKEKGKEIEKAESILIEVEEIKNQAENALIFKDESLASRLYQEAWKKVLPQTDIGSPLRKRAQDLKIKIEEDFAPLSKLEKILNPELLFNFKDIKIIPKKIQVLNSNLYFFNPFSFDFYKFSLGEKTGDVLKSIRKPKLVTSFSDSLLFFSSPDTLTRYFPEKESQEKILKSPFSDIQYTYLSRFRSNLYFFEENKKEIVKYKFEEKEKEFLPVLWFERQESKKTAIDFQSMTVDGSIWILMKNGEIQRYYGGVWQETLELSLFPYLKNPTKIWTSSLLPYLYILEPSENRIIIISKSGETIKQYQSDFFDNLLDFTVSENGRTIWLLNKQKIYQLKSNLE